MVRSQWVPRSRRGASATAYRDALYEGVPDWLTESLTAWIRPQLFHKVRNTLYDRFDDHWDHAFVRRLERMLEVKLNHDDRDSGVLQRCRTDEEFCLDVVDFLLAHRPDAKRRERLDEYLSEAGSAWVVREHDETYALEQRVDPTVADAVATTISGSERAGELLGAAWHSAYGRNPNPSHAFRECIRAVEVAAKPIVLPNDPKATLGLMIKALRDKPAKWSVEFNPPTGVDAVETLASMMELLWKSQFDRHGTDDESVPLAVSQSEAEGAVHLAAMLVHWFSHGVVRFR